MTTVIKLVESDEDSVRDKKIADAALESSELIKESISLEYGDKLGERVMSESCQNYIKLKIKKYLKDFGMGTFTIQPLEEDVDDVYEFLKRSRIEKTTLEK